MHITPELYFQLTVNSGCRHTRYRDEQLASAITPASTCVRQ